jgi:hypothetical protein
MTKLDQLKSVRSNLKSTMKIAKKTTIKNKVQRKFHFVNELIGYMVFFEEPARIALKRVQMKSPYNQKELNQLLSDERTY